MELHVARIHGREIAYRTAGEGPAVVLVHGMAGSSETWTTVTPYLSGGHRVIAPDLLGHGQSDKSAGDYSLGAYASALRDLIVGTLGIESATLVGQSLGGGVVMQTAYQYPELCERLVLVGSGGLGREVNAILRALTLPAVELAMPLLFPRIAKKGGDRVATFLASRGIRSPVATELWRAYASLVEPDNRRAFLRTLRAVIDQGGQSISATDRLYLAEAVPTLICWGDRDDIIPVDHAHSAHDLMPGSRLEIFEGAGHFLHVEEPQRFARLLDDFIATTEPAQADLERYRELLREGPGAGLA